jgi:hypothetical protein
MCDIPLPVGDAEKIVRAVFSNHLKKEKLKEYVFHPGSGPDEVSVMRHTYLGSDKCKARALQIKPRNPALKYKGLAAIGVDAVRNSGSQVTDSRHVFCGHAHISHGIQLPPPEDPLHSELMLRLDDRLRVLKDLARFFPDPDPTSDGWTGEAI